MNIEETIEAMTDVEKETLGIIYEYIDIQKRMGVITPLTPTVRVLMRVLDKASTSALHWRMSKLANRGIVLTGKEIRSRIALFYEEQNTTVGTYVLTKFGEEVALKLKEKQNEQV